MYDPHVSRLLLRSAQPHIRSSVTRPVCAFLHKGVVAAGVVTPFHSQFGLCFAHCCLRSTEADCDLFHGEWVEVCCAVVLGFFNEAAPAFPNIADALALSVDELCESTSLGADLAPTSISLSVFRSALSQHVPSGGLQLYKRSAANRVTDKSI